MKKKFTVTIVIILAIYIVGVILFSVKTYPKTKINGKTIGMIDKKEILDSNYDDYSLEIKGRKDKSDRISAQDIEYSLETETKIDIKQNPIIWPVSIFKEYDYKIEYSPKFNMEKLTEKINNSPLNKDVEKMENAKVKLVGEEFEIVKEKEGDELDLEKFKESILSSFLTKEDKLELEEEYLKPEIKEDDKKLKEELELKKSLFNLKITFDFDDRKEELSDDALMALYDNNDGEYILNKDKAREYVVSLAKKYDTFGKDRTFKSTGAGDVEVKGGIYGWQMDVDKVTQELIKSLETGKTESITPEYKQKGLSRKENDIGDTYVEIDLTRQHLWFYKEGKLVLETDIITGRPTADRETPTGTFKVWSRETNRNLTGEDYSSPVSFWLPINWGNIGMHDASWQSSFGGELYKTAAGSRGCINVPYEKIKTIYEEVKIDTPVVVYKS